MSAPLGDRARLVAVVHGMVQGVGYRMFVARESARAQLVGWVMNRADGSVEVVAEGPPGQLETLVKTLGDGPPGAWVSAVDVRWEPARGGLSEFSVRSGYHRGDV